MNAIYIFGAVVAFGVFGYFGLLGLLNLFWRGIEEATGVD